MTTIPTLESDPCARATALRAVRDKLITGATAVESEQEGGNGTRRRVKWTAANLTALDREISVAESACSLNGGGRPKRFAMGGRV